MKKNNAAIIGLGKWGKNLIREFSTKTNVDYCCTTGSGKNISWLEDNFGNTIHTTNFQETIDNPTIDTVIIATPIDTHFELTKRALVAGKNVFLEKPPTTNAKQANELKKIAAENKRLLFVDHILKYDRNFILLKEKLKNEKICSIQATWMKYGTFDNDIYWNLLYHYVYLIFELTPDVSIKSVEKIIDEEDVVKILLDTKDNIPISIHINRKSEQKFREFSVRTECEQYVWKNDQLFCGNDNYSLNKNTIQPVSDMINDFLNQIKEGRTGMTTDFAPQATAIIKKIKSAK